jgi:solute carrier family 45 protein 1/2/4
MEEQSYGHHHHQIGKAGGSSSSNQVPVAGIVLGIHNVFIVIPQFIISFISSVLFKFLEPGSSEQASADPPAARRTHTLSGIGWIFT